MLTREYPRAKMLLPITVRIWAQPNVRSYCRLSVQSGPRGIALVSSCCFCALPRRREDPGPPIAHPLA